MGDGGKGGYDSTAKSLKEVFDAIKKWSIAFMGFFQFDEAYKMSRKALKEIDGYSDRFASELSKAGIDYRLGKEGTVLINHKDLERVRDIEEELLVSYSKSVMVVDEQKLENALVHSKDVSDKRVLTLNLDQNEFQVLANKCNHLPQGFAIGKGEKNEKGERAFSLRESAVFTPYDPKEPKQYKNKDFCYAFLEAELSLFGPNEEIKAAQLEFDRQVDHTIKDLKDKDTVAYVVSASDNSKYIKLEEKGAKIYNRGEDGEWSFKEISTSDPRYDTLVKQATVNLYNRTVIYDDKELERHLDPDQDNVRAGRPRLTPEQAEAGKCSDEIAAKLDRIVKVHMKEVDFYDNNTKNAEVLFHKYKEECAKVLDVALDEKAETPKGYKEEDIETIRRSFKEHNIDPQTYKRVGEMMREQDGKLHKVKAAEITKETKTKETVTTEDRSR